MWIRDRAVLAGADGGAEVAAQPAGQRELAHGFLALEDEDLIPALSTWAPTV